MGCRKKIRPPPPPSPSKALHIPLNPALHTTADVDIQEVLDTGFQL